MSSVVSVERAPAARAPTATAPADPVLAAAEPVERALTALFDAEHERWSSVEPSLDRAVRELAEFVLAGGKRLRPAFVHWGFVGAGGHPADARLSKLGAAMELLHAFALLHDDVMDGASTRRGRPALHVSLQDEHRSSGWSGEARRFGDGLAVLLGDLAFVYADQLVAEVGIAHHGTAVRADLDALWNEMRVELTMGQYLDVMGAARADRDLGRAELIARYKSGRYSVERPLQLGAALAGRFRELAAPFREFGTPLGEAFQLRDDLLGALGDSETTGKPVGDDLREGKPTVLIAYAQHRASPSQRRRLSRVGRADLDADEVAQLQELLRETGAVECVERAIEVRARAAREALGAAPIDEHARAALAELVDRLAWRNR